MGFTLTDLSAVDTAIPEVWAKELLVDAEKMMFWKDYEGAQGSGMPIIRKDELTKQPGDTVRIITMSHLTGAGITGDTANLTDNEEALSIGEVVLTLAIKAHAVKYTKYADKQAVFNVRQAAQGRLAYWLADKLDQSMFIVLSTSATYNLYGGTATADAGLTTADVFNTTAIRKIKAKLRENKALPIKVEDGNEYYIIVIHPFDEFNLKADSTWQQAQREANLRGLTNPIFTGALGVYDGCIIRVSHNVPNGNVNSTAGVDAGIGAGAANVSHVIAFGGEAGARAYGQYPTWLEETKDYGRKLGIGTDVVFKDARAVQKNALVGHYYAKNPNS